MLKGLAYVALCSLWVGLSWQQNLTYWAWKLVINASIEDLFLENETKGKEMEYCTQQCQKHGKETSLIYHLSLNKHTTYLKNDQE